MLKIASLVAVLVLVSKGLGFLRETVIAGAYGKGIERDAYSLAYLLPSYALVILGGLNGPFHTATLAALTRMRAAGRQDRGRAVLTIVLSTGAVMAALSVGIYLAAFWIVSLFGPWAPLATRRLAAAQLQTMTPVLLVGAWVGVLCGVSNDRGEYALPSLSPAVSSLALIACVAWRPHDPLMLALGTTLGALAQLALQGIPAAWSAGTRVLSLRPLSLAEPALRDAGVLLWPAILSSSIGQVNVMIGTVFLSRADTGALSAWAYANTIYILPLGIFLSALLVPLFPQLTAAAAKQNWERLRILLNRAVVLVAAASLPMALGLSLAATPVVRVAFERHRFATTGGTGPTAMVLAILCLGLVAYAWRDLMVRVFYAMNDSRTPLRISMISVGLNLILNALFMFVFSLGLAGIALSTALVTWANCLQVAWALQKKLGPPFMITEGQTLLKFGLATAISGIGAWWVVHWHWPHRFSWNLAELGTVAVVMAILYAGALLAQGLRLGAIFRS